ncbi:AraC family transcriptional regulator [Caenorhabditis elegans]|uniref:AraC family transcriptional regulator n=1 Tax=Caenorhabditis elegans TaxID=6239 RepID=U4PAL0_CAEEL|nr:AraC family transcriptional regulator [Caenorhabditis elegans]CDH92933.1 AraC family transcriptional regulator [Caenorhabditis elegans]|eukprot:NP_001294249.1 Uncharacterized protein CELE_T09A12.8 [Caenorhabditis elegans]
MNFDESPFISEQFAKIQRHRLACVSGCSVRCDMVTRRRQRPAGPFLCL